MNVPRTPEDTYRHTGIENSNRRAFLAQALSVTVGLAGAAVVAGICAVPAVAKESDLRSVQKKGSQPPMRFITGTVRVDGRDKENIGSDEFIHEPRWVNRILIADQETLIPDVQKYKWGGECRVEIDMHTKLLPAPVAGGAGEIHVWGQTRFYEGDSVDTSDLEDWKDFFFSVPPLSFGGPPTRYVIDMVNRETIGGDDWAKVTFELKNTSGV